MKEKDAEAVELLRFKMAVAMLEAQLEGAKSRRRERGNECGCKEREDFTRDENSDLRRG